MVQNLSSCLETLCHVRGPLSNKRVRVPPNTMSGRIHRYCMLVHGSALCKTLYKWDMMCFPMVFRGQVQAMVSVKMATLGVIPSRLDSDPSADPVPDQTMLPTVS